MPSNSPSNTINRRSFFHAAAVSALAGVAAPAFAATEETPKTIGQLKYRTGNGEWTYEVIPQWGSLPQGTQFGGTHGAITSDHAGNLYVSTQSHTGVLVYDPHGKLVRTIATDYPEVHSFHHAEENGTEYLYATVQKGTPEDNWLFIKMKTDGTVVQKIKAPTEAGFHTPNEWRITAAVPAPDGSVFIANGYGDSRIFIFDKAGLGPEKRCRMPRGRRRRRGPL